MRKTEEKGNINSGKVGEKVRWIAAKNIIKGNFFFEKSGHKKEEKFDIEVGLPFHFLMMIVLSFPFPAGPNKTGFFNTDFPQM